MQGLHPLKALHRVAHKPPAPGDPGLADLLGGGGDGLAGPCLRVKEVEAAALAVCEPGPVAPVGQLVDDLVVADPAVLLRGGGVVPLPQGGHQVAAALDPLQLHRLEGDGEGGRRLAPVHRQAVVGGGVGLLPFGLGAGRREEEVPLVLPQKGPLLPTGGEGADLPLAHQPEAAVIAVVPVGPAHHRGGVSPLRGVAERGDKADLAQAAGSHLFQLYFPPFDVCLPVPKCRGSAGPAIRPAAPKGRFFPPSAPAGRPLGRGPPSLHRRCRSP